MVSIKSELNKSLIENQHQWKARIRELEEQKRNVDKENMLRIGELEAQVRSMNCSINITMDLT